MALSLGVARMKQPQGVGHRLEAGGQVGAGAVQHAAQDDEARGPLEAMETMKLQMIHEQGLLPDPTDLR